MNKLKLLYDVVKTMRDKDVLSGVIMARVHKNGDTIFSLQNDFQKNLLTGQTTAKISSELNYDGKVVKHESNTTFSLGTACAEGHPGAFRHFHHHGCKCKGLKAKLSKLACVFSILNSLKIEEQSNKPTILSLKMSDLSPDVQLSVKEHLQHKSAHGHGHGHGHCCCLKELAAMENLDFALNILVNKNNEVETMVLIVDGNGVDDTNTRQELKITGELNFAW